MQLTNFFIMSDSVFKQISAAMDEFTFAEDPTVADIQIDHSGRDPERDQETHRLLTKALTVDKIPRNILESAYMHFKSLLKGFLKNQFDEQVTGRSKHPSLRQEDKENIFTIVSKASIIAMRATITTVENNGSDETNREIEALTKILELYSANPELMRALFEDAYEDAIIEFMRGDTGEEVIKVVLPNVPVAAE